MNCLRKILNCKSLNKQDSCDYEGYCPKESDSFIAEIDGSDILNNDLDELKNVVENSKVIEDPPHLKFLKSKIMVHKLVSDGEQQKAKKFMQDVYDKLDKNPIASLILKFLALFKNVKISVDSNKNEFNCEGRPDGLTWARDYEIIIAIKGFEDERNERRLMGLIIHEFCHFALYFTYQNYYRPYEYYNFQVYKNITLECMENNKKILKELKNDRVGEMCDDEEETFYEKIKDNEVFEQYYDDESVFINELAVRCVQCFVEFEEDERRLNLFRTKYPKLCQDFETRIVEKLENAYEYLDQYIKLSGAFIEDLIINSEYLKYDEEKNVLNDRSRFLHHEYESNEKNVIIYTNQPFLSTVKAYKYMKEANLSHFDTTRLLFTSEIFKDETQIEEFKNVLSFHTEFISHIFIYCSSYDATIITKIENLIANYGTFNNFTLILPSQSKAKSSLCTTLELRDFLVQPEHLSECFFEKTLISIQERNVLLSDLISYQEFIKLDSLPSHEITKFHLEFTDNMKINYCEEYVEREFCSESSEILDSNNVLINNRCILITGECGNGKTTELKQLYYKLQDKFQNNFIIYMNLSEKKNLLNRVKKEGLDTLYDLLRFLSECLGLDSFEASLFQVLINKSQVVFLIDSFDEISPTRTAEAEKILLSIKNLTNCKLIVGSRDYLSEKLCSIVDFKHIKLLTLNIENRSNFIDKLTLKYDVKEINKEQIKEFIVEKNYITPLLIKMIVRLAQDILIIEMENFTQNDIYKYFVNLIHEHESSIRDEKKILLDGKNKIEKLKNFYIGLAIEKMSHILKSNYFEILGERCEPPEVEEAQRNGIVSLIEFSSGENEYNKSELDSLNLKSAEYVKLNGKYFIWTFQHNSFERYFLSEFVMDLLGNDSNSGTFMIDFRYDSVSKLFDGDAVYEIISFLQHDNRFQSKFGILSGVIQLYFGGQRTKLYELGLGAIIQKQIQNINFSGFLDIEKSSRFFSEQKSQQSFFLNYKDHFELKNSEYAVTLIITYMKKITFKFFLTEF